MPLAARRAMISVLIFSLVSSAKSMPSTRSFKDRLISSYTSLYALRMVAYRFFHTGLSFSYLAFSSFHLISFSSLYLDAGLVGSTSAIVLSCTILSKSPRCLGAVLIACLPSEITASVCLLKSPLNPARSLISVLNLVPSLPENTLSPISDIAGNGRIEKRADLTAPVPVSMAPLNAAFWPSVR